MNDNTPSDLRPQRQFSHASSSFEHVSQYSEGEGISSHNPETQHAESSRTNLINEPEIYGNNETNRPRRSSSLTEAIRARPDILLQESPHNDSLYVQRRLPRDPMDDPSPETENLLEGPYKYSKNPEDRNLHLEEKAARKRLLREQKALRDGTIFATGEGRSTPDRPIENSEAFTPTVRRRKAEFQREQERKKALYATSYPNQGSQDDEVIAESSAQAAQRLSASAPGGSDEPHSGDTNIYDEDSTGGSRESAREKSSSLSNPSHRAQPVLEFDGNESGSSSNSELRTSISPSIPPQQHQRTVSGITVERRTSEIMLPRWQPDSEVDECPICQRPFSFFSRKHHCRKCGRVVCNACSPHRITIPYQYIVQPPLGYEDITLEHARSRSRTISQSFLQNTEVGGGMKVRLCNPCVPDPNTSPPTPMPPVERPLPPLPQPSPSTTQPPATATPRRERVRRSQLCPVCGDRLPPSTTALENHIDRCITRHLREVELSVPMARPRQPDPLQATTTTAASSSLPSSTNTLSRTTRPRHTSEATTLSNVEVSYNSLSSSSRNQNQNQNRAQSQHQAQAQAPEVPAPSRPFLSSRMICYAATQLDTVGEDSECIICMEDFEVGVEMARLECLCKFHKNCIDGWFFQHPGRCPVHGQDNY